MNTIYPHNTGWKRKKDKIRFVAGLYVTCTNRTNLGRECAFYQRVFLKRAPHESNIFKNKNTFLGCHFHIFIKKEASLSFTANMTCWASNSRMLSAFATLVEHHLKATFGEMCISSVPLVSHFLWKWRIMTQGPELGKTRFWFFFTLLCSEKQINFRIPRWKW